jgi:transcriptional regulator with XRE-family HTH domain
MAKEICIRFGARVKNLRKAKKWTQTYLSVHSGLSRTFISDVEMGRKEPCLRTLETFADALGVSLGQLMSGL